MSIKQAFPYAFFKGGIVPVNKAKVSVMTHALQYGTAVFAGIRAYVSADKKQLYIFRLSDHYDRFLNSLKIVNKKIRYSQKELIDITKKLVHKNNPQTDAYIRPFAYASDLNISPDLHSIKFDFCIYVIPLGEYLPINKGLRLSISSWTRISDDIIPSRGKLSGGYINSSLAKADATRLGFDETLMLASDGHIAEASAANFFIVRDNVLITPSKNSDILEGITRKTIIKLASDLKFTVEERKVDRSEIYVAQEAFLCGTGVQVAWVAEVDDRKIGNGKIGPLTSKIQKLFFDIVRGKEKKYISWLTKVN